MADGRTLTDRARSALIRDWAEENGFEVSAKGRIAAGVVAAYEAATGQEPSGEDGPDWSMMDGASVADPLADNGIEPGDEGQAAAGADGDTAGPPPPASLDEARARLGGKPKRPAWAKDNATAKPKAQPVKVTRRVIGDIEGKLTLLLAGPAAMWQMADPLCGGAFADNLDTIVRKAVPLIVQSPEAVRWFTKGTTFLLWLDLVWALQPVAQAVYAHHVAGSVMIDPKTGQVVPAKRLEDGRIVPADSPVAREARPDQSAYTTQVAGHVPPVSA